MRGPLLLLVALVGCGPDRTAPTYGTTPQPGTPVTTGSGSPSTEPTDCELAGYAEGTTGLSGDELWNALESLTAAHECRDYTQTTIFMFTRLDKVNNEVECVYTGRKTMVVSSKPDADDMNTEHSWPQSEGADTFPAKCDLHHLYPSDTDTNAERASLPFGVVAGGAAFESGGSKRGTDRDGTEVFEPRDAHKGNVARSMLYFAARYGYRLPGDEIALYQDWHALDPVDDAELARTWAIADRQVLTNPLVVCPGLVDQL